VSRHPFLQAVTSQNSSCSTRHTASFKQKNMAHYFPHLFVYMSM
jgi:hypothetical protein